MSRLSAFTTRIALPVLALSLGAALPMAGAQAQNRDSGAFYVAQLEQGQETARFAAGGVVWSCEGTVCRAPRSNARPLRICHELKRKAGVITGFSSDGEAMAPDRLERCNR